MTYDSRPDTYAHIREVRRLLRAVIRDLDARAQQHDLSKLGDVERPIFDEMTPLLKTTAYNMPEYYAMLARMKPALDHHYAENRHHPEHWAKEGDGPGDAIHRMSLLDVIEMLCDWHAAGQRQPGGNLRKSIEANAARFGYGEEFKQLLLNTVPFIENS